MKEYTLYHFEGTVDRLEHYVYFNVLNYSLLVKIGGSHWIIYSLIKTYEIPDSLQEVKSCEGLLTHSSVVVRSYIKNFLPNFKNEK